MALAQAGPDETAEPTVAAGMILDGVLPSTGSATIAASARLAG